MSENLILPSQEALVRYPMFYRQSVQRRLTQLKYLQDRASLTQLPKDSVLHLLDDNFMVNKPLVMVPDDRNWLLSLQPSFKFLQHVVEPLPQRWCELPEQLFLPARGVYPTIRRHRLTHLRTMRPWTFDKVPNRMNSQLVVSYLPLYRARILGLQRQTRRFNYIFANLLNGIAQLPDRTHFIPIPVSNRAYLRPDFMLSFKSYNKISIKYPQDMWYQFMMHLLGFLYHDHTDSLLENVPEDMWEKIHFIFYAGDKMVIHTLKNLKTWNGDHDTAMLRIISQCNQLALLGSAVSIIEHDELVETVPEPEPPTDPVIVVDQTHQPVETAPTEDAIPAVAAPEPEEEQPDPQVTQPDVNHPVTDAEKEEAQQLEQRLPAKLKPLIPSGLIQVGQRGIVAGAAKTANKTVSKTPAKTKEPPTPEPTPEPEDTEEPDSQSLDKFYEAINQQIDSLDGKWDSDSPEELLSTPEMEVKRVYNAPKFRMHDDLKQRREKLLKSEMQELDAAAAEYIDSREELSPAQKNKLKELSTNYKQIRVNGRTVKDILNEAPDDAVNKSKLDCLKGQVTEDSMLECSTDKFDQDYMDKLFLRDLVSELASFNAHGMFLQNVEITDKSDWMSDLQEVSVAYIDENREKHNFKFTLPKVNRQGYLKVNGTVKVLKKQRFPVPIAKVSPTRVALTSDYNKYLVERNQMAAHSFINYIDRILEKAGDLAKVRLHFHTYDVCLPYEYVALGRKYSQLDLRQHDDKNEHWRLKFVDNPLDYEQHWLLEDNDCPFSAAEKHQVLQDVQEAHGVLVGYQLEHKLYLYMLLDGTCIVRQLSQNLEIVNEGSFIDVLTEIVGVSVNGLTEWVDLKLLSKAVPAIFALCYRYGLSHMLNYTGVGYYLLNKDTRSRRKASDIVLKFKDATLVIPRNPLKFGLLFGGLGYYDLKRYNLADMDEKGPYYDLLEQKRMSTYNIRGIDNYLDFFVDPITKEILTEMHEPTTAKDLLIRSCELLTTEDHPPVAASNNFRYRSYERINAAVYKTLSKQFAMVKRDTTGRLKFTIPSFEVQQLIMTDQMLENVDIINPINDIKYKQEYGHGGFGGRESIETFMVVDRQFTDDSVGICSEGSPESGKVAYAASLSMNPSFYNLRGMTELKRIEGKKISPTEMVSCTSVLMPGVCQDDGKRANLNY